MVDVFISYAQKERDLMIPMKTRLEALGLALFVDVEGRLDDSQTFPEALDRGVRSAKAVLGCWSPWALSRAWVRKECLFALQENKLVATARAPLSNDTVPLSFIDVDRKDLVDFSGEVPHEGWASTLTALAAKFKIWVERNASDSEAEFVIDKVAILEKAALTERRQLLDRQSSTNKSSGPRASASLTSTSEDAWRRIEESLDETHYRRFEKTFENDPAAFARLIDAEERIKALESWKAVDKSDPAQLARLLEGNPFPALGRVVTLEMQRASQAREEVARSLEMQRAQARQEAAKATLARLTQLKSLAQSQRFGLETEQLQEVASLFRAATVGDYENEVSSFKDQFEFEFGYYHYDVSGSPYDGFRTIVELHNIDEDTERPKIALYLQKGEAGKRTGMMWSPDRTVLAWRQGSMTG